MQIANNTAVTIHYVLTNDSGETLDSSHDGEPLVYLHGKGNIISGLEQALHGKNVGDKFQVRVEAKDAYGEFDPRQLQVVSIDMFEGISPLAVGMQFHAALNSGTGVITITKIEGDDITIDGNHPLAGQPLNFDVEVLEVRLATKEETEHGHIHGPGCHH